MTIVSFSREGDNIRVLTDDVGRNEFVYPSSRFSTLEQLQNEINKSLALEQKRKMSTSEKFVRLSSALKLNGAIEVTKEAVVDGPN